MTRNVIAAPSKKTTANRHKLLLLGAMFYRLAFVLVFCFSLVDLRFRDGDNLFSKLLEPLEWCGC